MLEPPSALLDVLRSLRLEHYEKELEENGVDLDTLQYCNDQDLRDCGVAQAEARAALIRFAANLRRASQPAS